MAPSIPNEESRLTTRSWWSHQLRQWHWISSALCLVGMLLFAVTGITLNHAAAIPASVTRSLTEAQLPQDLIAAIGTAEDGQRPFPAPVADWLAEHAGLSVAGRDAEWSDGEIYLALPRPGGDAWLSVERETGAIVYERTERGWIALLNDLHKGRDSGAAWRLFIDVFAVACVLFCVTGLGLLWLHAGQRGSTWPTVGLGLVIPLLLVIFLLH